MIPQELEIPPAPAGSWTHALGAAFAATVAVLAAGDAYREILGSIPAFAAAWYVLRAE